MGRKFNNFARSVQRHGVWRTALRYAHTQLNRVMTFDVYRVQSGYTDDPGTTTLKGYELRTVSQDEFQDRLCQELKNHDMRWAFERGDLCVAALFEGEIVAYDFRSNQPAPFEDGLMFYFPSSYMVGFVSITAPSHRGHGIARELWAFARQTIIARGGIVPSNIWTASVFNLESLAAIRSSGTQYEFHGYAAYLRLFGRWFTFASPRCRALGAGFRRVDA